MYSCSLPHKDLSEKLLERSQQHNNKRQPFQNDALNTIDSYEINEIFQEVLGKIQFFKESVKYHATTEVAIKKSMEVAKGLKKETAIFISNINGSFIVIKEMIIFLLSVSSSYCLL